MATAGDVTTRAYRPVPGPIDRTNFLEAQQRHRRASRRFSAVATIAVFLTGMPLSVLFTPFVYAIALIAGYAANMFSPVPAAAWRMVKDIPFVLVAASGLAAVVAGKNNAVTPQQAAGMAAALVLPGALFLFCVWVGLRLVFRHAGVGGVLLTLGARAPTSGDLEERQLVNLVEEMAIAAGVPPPRVMLIDGDAVNGAANAAAVGWSISDATIVVTRPLLDRLSRDETQGIIARVIGGVGNGDLKIAFIILSLFQTVGLATLTLNAFFGWEARRALWQLLRLALTPGRSQNRAARESDVMALLARSADSNADMSTYMQRHQGTGCLSVLQLPLLLGVAFPIMTSNFIVGISTAMFTGPIMGLMWKRRELLADATAVQLTRNPDGLAAALERLQQLTVRVPKSDSISHLFAVWGGQRGPTAEERAQLDELLSRQNSGLARVQALVALRASQRADASRGASDASDSESAASGVTVMSRYMHATLDRRLGQLRALGAHDNPAERPAVTPVLALRPRPRHRPILALLIVSPLVVLVCGLMALAFALLMGLDLVFMSLMLVGVWGVSRLLFVVLPSLWYHPRGVGP
jgi:Zn-dependent protease with chaperone function